MNQLMNNGMIQEIENILLNARNHVSVEVNHTLLKTYMEIGKIIVEDAVSHNSDNDYESKTISYLSKELTKKFGRGFSRNVIKLRNDEPSGYNCLDGIFI